MAKDGPGAYDLFILFWSKIYRGCPDTPHKFYSISQLDQI